MYLCCHASHTHVPSPLQAHTHTYIHTHTHTYTHTHTHKYTHAIASLCSISYKTYKNYVQFPKKHSRIINIFDKPKIESEAFTSYFRFSPFPCSHVCILASIYHLNTKCLLIENSRFSLGKYFKSSSAAYIHTI